MWRRLLSRAHPDAGGDHELFIWTGTLRDAVCGGGLQVQSRPASARARHSTRSSSPDDKPRIPYPVEMDFEESTRRALALALDVQEVYAEVLSLLADCYPQPRGNLAHEETRGASYSRLAAICHAWGMTKSERVGFYPVAEAIPLSDRHASHILGRLKRRAA